MKLRTCYFYIAWFSGSPSAEEEEEGDRKDGNPILAQADLIREYKKCNERVTRYEYEAPEGFEWPVGASKAFLDNYTGRDSVSVWEYKH